MSVGIKKSFVNNRCKTAEPPKERFLFGATFGEGSVMYFISGLIRLLTVAGLFFFLKKKEQNSIFCEGLPISISAVKNCVPFYAQSTQ